MHERQNLLVHLRHFRMAHRNLCSPERSGDHRGDTAQKRKPAVRDAPEFADTAPPDHGATDPVTVLIVDDHPAMRESIREIIETDNTLEVVGAAGRIAEAISLAKLWEPEVAVLDVNMPDGGGWAAARGLREVCPDIRLVAYSSFEDALVTRTMTAAGISAYVTKGSDIALLLAAVHGADIMPLPRSDQTLIRRSTAGAAG
jgi:CheY-like chemotaxis protein